MNLLRQNKTIAPIAFEQKFLSDEEIEKIKKISKRKRPQMASVGGDHRDHQEKKKEFTLDSHIKDCSVGNVPRLRITTIKWLELCDDTEWLFKKIIDKINEVNQNNFNFYLKFIENLQFSEYTDEQKGFYSIHNDIGDKNDLRNHVDIRKLSFSIQLTDENEYEGGELIFYINGEKVTAPKSKGTIIFFESEINHEVKPVTKGIRHALVSWVLGPYLR